MPIKRTRPRFANLVAWSFSTYTQWLKCPFSVCLEKVQRIRIQEPWNPHFAKGDAAHAIAEDALKGVGKRLPPLTREVTTPDGGPPIRVDMTPVKDRLKALKAANARGEQEWAFTRDWTPTGWFDRDVWVRIKTDACADTEEPPHVDIVDWKTGKVHEADHRLQRRLYATGGLQLVQIGVLAGGDKKADCTAQHVYVDTGQTATETFKMKELAALKREWAARVKPMMEDTQFPTRIGFHCKYCKYAKSRGGPCPEKQ